MNGTKTKSQTVNVLIAALKPLMELLTINVTIRRRYAKHVIPRHVIYHARGRQMTNDTELDALVKRLENVSLQVGFPSRTILDSAVIRQAIDTITTLRAQLAEARAELRITLACNRGLVRLNEATQDRADRAEAALAAQVTVKPDPVREITIRLDTAEVCALLDKAEADLQHLNTIAATIRVNTLRHGGTHEQADAFIKGEADFVAWMVAKVQPTVSPDVAALVEALEEIANDQFADLDGAKRSIRAALARVKGGE